MKKYFVKINYRFWDADEKRYHDGSMCLFLSPKASTEVSFRSAIRQTMSKRGYKDIVYTI